MLFSDKVVECDIIKWKVAVIFSECVAADDIILPCAEQETEELYQQVTGINEGKEKEIEEEEVDAVCEPLLTFTKCLETMDVSSPMSLWHLTVHNRKCLKDFVFER